MRGTVTGPGAKPEYVMVEFESPGGVWNRLPHEISRTKPEDLVWLFVFLRFIRWSPFNRKLKNICFLS